MPTSTPPTEASPVRVPPLRNGDHLTADEFLRRYQMMPDLKKAELIDGQVYIPSPAFFTQALRGYGMASPVSIDNHSAPHFDLIVWLGFYRAATIGVRGSDNGTVRLDLKNVPQPDAFLFLREEYGGQSRIGADDFLHGAPELVAEIAYSSVSKDLHEKLEMYRRNRAQEYVVWRIEDQVIDWFAIRDGQYDRLAPGDDGTLRSQVFPGLWLDPDALIRGDLAAVFATVQRGLATPEHADFVERLARAKGD